MTRPPRTKRFLQLALASFAAWVVLAIGPAQAEHPSCGQLFKIKSLNSNRPTKITFINSSSSARALLWLDFTGQPKDYGLLNPGQRQTFDTYLTHPWMVANGPGDCLRIVQPRPGGSVVRLDDRDTAQPSGEEGGVLKGCPPGTRPKPETDDCIAIRPTHGGGDQLLGRWGQVESNAGDCATCSIHFERRGDGLKVVSNNGWSARIRPDASGDNNGFAGTGRWNRAVGGAYGGRPFSITFYLTKRRLHMTMTVPLAGGRVSEVRASYVP